MGLLVSELEQTLDRVLVVAPTYMHLRDLLETLSFDLTTRTGVGQKLDLVLSPALDGGLAKAWMSVTLGVRARLASRMSFVGYGLDRGSPSASAFLAADSLLIWAPQGEAALDRLLKLSVPESATRKPCVILGMLGGAGGGARQQQGIQDFSLRDKALVEWARRRFSNPLFVEKPENYFQEALEWLLSFS